MQTRNAWNASRYRSGDAGGFYESYFLRANHPDRPLAFWIRYTVFSPAGRPSDAEGELWAIVFDGETDHIVAVKEARPVSECRFSTTGLDVRIGDATLGAGALEGQARAHGHHVRWALRFDGNDEPLLLLPRSWYERPLPKAKALVGTPSARYIGTVAVDGRAIAIDGWTGSQNHNWGRRHTDRYAWGQVAGFDDAPGAFLECATAQIRLGPFWSPRLTFLVLREGGRVIALNGAVEAVRASAEVASLSWTFDARGHGVRVTGSLQAPPSAFVGLRYRNPPGGEKICLNTKLARAEVTVHERGRAPWTLATRHRAAFEILGDAGDARVPVVL